MSSSWCNMCLGIKWFYESRESFIITLMSIPDNLCKGLVDEYRQGNTKHQIFYNTLGARHEDILQFNKKHRECFDEVRTEHLQNYQKKLAEFKPKHKDEMNYRDHIKKAGIKLSKFNEIK